MDLLLLSGLALSQSSQSCRSNIVWWAADWFPYPLSCSLVVLFVVVIVLLQWQNYRRGNILACVCEKSWSTSVESTSKWIITLNWHHKYMYTTTETWIGYDNTPPGNLRMCPLVEFMHLVLLTGVIICDSDLLCASACNVNQVLLIPFVDPTLFWFLSHDFMFQTALLHGVICSVTCKSFKCMLLEKLNAQVFVFCFSVQNFHTQTLPHWVHLIFHLDRISGDRVYETKWVATLTVQYNYCLTISTIKPALECESIRDVWVDWLFRISVKNIAQFQPTKKHLS